MSENKKYTLDIILDHLNVREKRFSEIKIPNDFVSTEYGNPLLDTIVVRLQAVGETLKRILKHNTILKEKYPNIEWDKIIMFRDFISHHYKKLDYEVIFDICEIDVPQLKEVINIELKNVSLFVQLSIKPSIFIEIDKMDAEINENVLKVSKGK